MNTQVNTGKKDDTYVSDSVVKGKEAAKAKEDKKLPSTGSETSILALITGVLLLVVGAIYSRFTVKKK